MRAAAIEEKKVARFAFVSYLRRRYLFVMNTIQSQRRMNELIEVRRAAGNEINETNSLT